MNKTQRNILGMAVYFLIAVLFGGGYALLALIVHEDNDRCHYGGGKFETGDLIRGCISIALGMMIHYWIGGGAKW